MPNMLERAKQTREKINIGVRGAIESGAVEAGDVSQTVPVFAPGVHVERGDLCVDGGKLYRCVQSHATQADWRPAVVPALWTYMGEALAVESPGSDSTLPWIQPTGGHDAYAKGAKVAHKGKTWESTADSNVWEPGVYGWTETT